MKNEDTKGIKLAIIFAMIISIIVCVIFRLEDAAIEEINIGDYTQADLVYYVDNIEIDSSILMIDGWVYKKDTGVKIGNDNYDRISIYVALKNNLGDFLRLPTELMLRSDITEYANDGYDRAWSGFMSRTSIDKIDLNNSYEVYLFYKINDKGYYVNTGKVVGGENK